MANERYTFTLEIFQHIPYHWIPHRQKSSEEANLLNVHRVYPKDSIVLPRPPTHWLLSANSRVWPDIFVLWFVCRKISRQTRYICTAFNSCYALVWSNLQYIPCAHERNMHLRIIRFNFNLFSGFTSIILQSVLNSNVFNFLFLLSSFLCH
jgi:hypothetical protein